MRLKWWAEIPGEFMGTVTVLFDLIGDDGTVYHCCRLNVTPHDAAEFKTAIDSKPVSRQE